MKVSTKIKARSNLWIAYAENLSLLAVLPLMVGCGDGGFGVVVPDTIIHPAPPSAASASGEFQLTGGSQMADERSKNFEIASQFISGFYKFYLGREASPSELNSSIDQALAGRPLSEIQAEIMNSPEAKIRQMYLSHLLREPEKAAMANWLSEYARGQSLGQIENGVRKLNDCKVACL